MIKTLIFNVFLTTIVAGFSVEKTVLAELLQKHCIDCHDEDLSEGDVRFDKDILNDSELLEKAFLQVRSVDMPPPKKKKMPIGERQELLRLLAGQHSHVHKPKKLS